jgi:hypothetical protein
LPGPHGHLLFVDKDPSRAAQHHIQIIDVILGNPSDRPIRPASVAA